ncbi:hypothetical protein GCM10018793_30420 [Streptomyces sulfonofaciens]|uniref:Pvc16 N-terminal domain-containing protein n=1 Tax=Streptomyces sulfonofaciens TaxID=68272 RepID=A0A919G6G0_9ACTN|nr:DUF4255 domain-containing protein [Streptomyces sulfonofaciens]GHH78860.1 hypothetical protein GCM10018793_30420 [Streptomyces sulfonofaciens]
MSNALAIAHVTQALALLVENNLRPEIDMAVSVETRKPPAEPPPEPTINVFLYQVTPNAHLRNNDLVTRAADGTLLKRAAAALDLHYVISAYGEENELVGQRLIGSVVRTLHEFPALPRDVVEAAAQLPYLQGSDLADAPQRVRFTPQVMDVDETSKLWGMLYQTPYTLSVVYQATLVLIDGREQPVPARPVERSTVRVLPFGAPGAPVPPRAGSGAGVLGGAGHAGAADSGDGTPARGAADAGGLVDGGPTEPGGRGPAGGGRARKAGGSTAKKARSPAKAAQPPAKAVTRKAAAKKTAAKRTRRATGPEGPADGEG